MHDLDKYLFFIAFVSHFLPVKIGDFLGKLVFWCIYPLTPVVAIVGLVLKLMGVVHFTLIEVLMGPFVMMLYGGLQVAIGFGFGLYFHVFCETMFPGFDEYRR